MPLLRRVELGYFEVLVSEHNLAIMVTGTRSHNANKVDAELGQFKESEYQQAYAFGEIQQLIFGGGSYILSSLLFTLSILQKVSTKMIKR